MSSKPISRIKLLKSCPDLPINGLPVAASCLPGASPIKTTSALGFPSPGTALPFLPTLQTLQFSISLVIFSNSCCLSIAATIILYSLFCYLVNCKNIDIIALQLMKQLMFKVITDLAEAKALWEIFSPNSTIDDEWAFRYEFYKYLNF